MKIIKSNNVFFDMEGKTKYEVLKNISKQAFLLKISNNQEKLFQDFLDREKESSTGFENGFAIPHARSATITKPTLFFIRLKEEVDWESLDNQKTKYLFVILIPKENKNNIHIEILSKISIMLMNKNFVQTIKKLNDENEVSDLIQKTIEKKLHEESLIQSNNINSNNKIKILALTACPVGVAHTYLAAEKLAEAAKENNYLIKIETHGSAGVKNNFTQKDIDDANIILVCSDIGLNLDRFNNKKIYQTTIKPAIHKPLETIQEAIAKARIYKTNEKEMNNSKQNNGKSFIMKHILAGISYMVPFVILGGICIALSLGIGKIIYGENSSAPKGDFLWYIEKIGGTAFTLMIGALGAYIANSISGRSAIAPAFIVCTIANMPELIYPIGGINVVTAMGFVGSILFGLLIGYTVKWINTWRINKNISAIMPIFVVPIGVGLFYSLIAIFVIGAPIGFVMDKFINSLESVFKNDQNVSIIAGIGFGLLFGAMAGFDMGGPINKVAFLSCSALITSKVYEPMGMMAVAIPCAPLGMAICTMIFRHKFDEKERTLGISAFVMGLIGISEGAIPFAVSDPKRAIISNVVGSAVAGAIAGAFGVTCAAAHGGPIVGVLGAIGSNKSYGLAGGVGFFFVAIIIGSLVTALMYGFLRKNQNNSNNNFSFWQKIKKVMNKNKINNSNSKQFKMNYLVFGVK